MSKNITDHKRERQVTAKIRDLRQQQDQSRSLQKQGPSAIRLALVEGYMEIPLSLSVVENAQFIDFTAPSDATIMIGSLLYSTYMVIYNPLFPDNPADVYTLDTSNFGWAGVQFNTWLPHSLSPDDPDYVTPNTLGSVASNRIPDNRVRIASKVNLQEGMWTTDTVLVIVYFQLRMTIGWN